MEIVFLLLGRFRTWAGPASAGIRDLQNLDLPGKMSRTNRSESKASVIQVEREKAGCRRSCERSKKHPAVGPGHIERALLTKLISSWDFTVPRGEGGGGGRCGVGVGCCLQALGFQVLSPPLVGREPCCDFQTRDHEGFLPLTGSLDHAEGCVVLMRGGGILLPHSSGRISPFYPPHFYLQEELKVKWHKESKHSFHFWGNTFFLHLILS